MEKKGNRNISNASRGSSGTDLKKSQDVTGKQGPRNVSRRREPSCGFSKSNESSRKPPPQRNTKAFDKRPKPRGLYYSGAVPRNEETCLEEFNELEWGSVFLPGSKKQSLNHLLNFSFAPRDYSYGRYQPEKKGTSKQAEKWLATKKHKYNKEHFLQANCQFIVNENGDYREYMNNPDALVDWNLIEQVNVQVNQQPSCPICLYPPIAAKMTKCGHVYCWSCILHYLSLSDKTYRKCPICYDAVKKEDLKSVIAIPHKTFNINDTITFKLMKRQKGSLIAYPVDSEVPDESSVFNRLDKTRENYYSKLLLANKGHILDILDRERTELDVQMAEDENCPEICFIEEAIAILNERKDKVLSDVYESCDEKTKEVLDDVVNENETEELFNEEVNDTENNNGEAEFNLTEAEGGAQVAKFHYFYQVADGQHIYLHVINAKMLEHCYGSLEFGPKTITGRILEKEGGSMTEELRKKLRYLQHMPVTCQFELAEIKLNEPAVTKETLEHFKDQIEKRKKSRQQRAKEEKKREKRIEDEENRKIGKYSGATNLYLDSRDQFPDVKEANDMYPELLDLRQRAESESTFQTTSDRSASPELSSVMSSMSLESGYSGPSFATMLASEKKTTRRTLQSSQSGRQSSSAPVKLINVTGSKMMSSSNVRFSRRHEDSEPELSDFEPVPDFNRSFGDALAQNLAKHMEDAGKQSTADSKPGKKKKKQKQKLLFSTHMACPGN